MHLKSEQEPNLKANSEDIKDLSFSDKLSHSLGHFKDIFVSIEDEITKELHELK